MSTQSLKPMMGSFWLRHMSMVDSDTIVAQINTEFLTRSDGLLNNNINRNSFFNEQNILYFGTIEEGIEFTTSTL